MKSIKSKRILIICLALVLVFTLSACGGPEEVKYSDQTAKIEKTAAKGSLNRLSGKYLVQGMKGYYEIFEGNGKGLISQHGTYKFTDDGKIKLTYQMSGAGMKYSISQSDDKKVSTLRNGKIKLPCTYVSGTAGLYKAKDAFTGVYSLNEDTKMVFSDDGTFRQIQTFSYSVSGHVLKQTSGKDTQKYKWKSSKGRILISLNGTTVNRLKPASK